MPLLDAVIDDLQGFTLTPEGDILTEDFFDTAIKMSLFSEQRAAPSEVLPASKRRGWMGNESTPGFENGSKIWLYEQSRVTRSVLNAIETATENALQWMIDESIAVSVDVTAGLKNSAVVLNILLTRPNSKVEQRYYNLWENTGV